MSDRKTYPATKKPRKRKALRPEDIDNVGQAILTLAQELWAVKDRQAVTEAVLKARGIDISEEVDTHIPDASLEAKLSAAREALVQKIVMDLTGDYGPLE
ncbi:MAG: hypothetical protein GKS03_04810 [Alphaproteobacteria bacterium]|nr:hypothetical protein [Alphaproteobacteria bacterium]